jgi:hypothetical protein
MRDVVTTRCSPRKGWPARSEPAGPPRRFYLGLCAPLIGATLRNEPHSVANRGESVASFLSRR